MEAQGRALRQRTTTSKFDDLTDIDVYNAHAQYLVRCGHELLMGQGKSFSVDEDNRDVLHFLLLYFNHCQRATNAEEYKNPAYARLFSQASLDKNLMIVGQVGTGKTLLMQAFGLYLERTHNPLAYKSTSVTELLNYYKVNEHLDYWTYNTGRNSAEGKPFAVCLNDVGLETMKHFGNDLQDVIDEYFHARNEVYTQWGYRSHITSNLDKKQILQLFSDPYKRLEDRFKTYNIIPLIGESRR